MNDENKKIEILLKWVKDKEEEAGENADKALESNRETAYSRYNNVWATYRKVREQIEKL